MDSFSLVAPFYGLMRGPRKTARQLEQFVEIAKPQPNERLLDLGGGTGRMSNRLMGKVKESVVLDSSHGMLVQARKKGCPRIVRGRSEELPFSEDSFQIVMCVDAFHHFTGQDRCLAEINRVLAPGGRVFFQDFDAARPSVKAMSIIERLLGGHSSCWRPQELRDGLLSQGFRVSREERERLSYSLLMEKPGR